VKAILWSDIATGAVFIRNQSAHLMPVEQMWCGTAADAEAPRADVRLERRAGVTQTPIMLRCHDAAAGLACSQPGDR
jgi:hypothetical protein